MLADHFRSTSATTLFERPGNKDVVGYCVRIDTALPEGVEPAKVKELTEILDNPPLIDGAMLDLTRWLASYYACAWGQALDAVVPAGVKKQSGTRIGTFLVVTEEICAARRRRAARTRTPKQAEAFAVLCRADDPLTT